METTVRYLAVQFGSSIFTTAPRDWGVSRTADHEPIADGLTRADAEQLAGEWNRQPWRAADRSQCHDKAGLIAPAGR